MQLKKIKSYMMPISMIIGLIFYPYLGHLSWLMPYLIFFMLLMTYTNISIREVKFSKLHLWLLSFQLVGSVLIYLLLYRFNLIIAQSAMICILAPTATSAVVITGMLGGNTASLTAYSLLSNLMVAIIAPIFFTIIGSEIELSFIEELWHISQRVCTLLLLPFILAILIRNISPSLHSKMRKFQSISFYLWNLALMIVTARTIQFLTIEGPSHLLSTIIIALLALCICLFQFYWGRRLGTKVDDTIAGGQGLGQKNTILAIWMAQTYLNPLSSIGPGTYILWQNVVNSWQLWKKTNR